MMKNITLGQYYPVDSWVHRLDPRTKILLTVAMIVAVFVVKTMVGYGLILGFMYLVSRLSNIVTNIAGELVVNNVNLRLMHKAKTVDLASFDRPEFYEKLENANREAGMRPIQILSSTFSMVRPWWAISSGPSRWM